MWGGNCQTNLINLKLGSTEIQRRQWHPTPVLLPGKFHWTEEPGRLQSMGLVRVRHDWATSLSLFTFLHWRRNWQPTPVFLPGESQGLGSLVGLPPTGSHRVGHGWSDLAAAAQKLINIKKGDRKKKGQEKKEDQSSVRDGKYLTF